MLFNVIGELGLCLFVLLSPEQGLHPQGHLTVHDGCRDTSHCACAPGREHGAVSEERVPCSPESRVVGWSSVAGEVTLSSAVLGLVTVPTLQRLGRSRRSNVGSTYGVGRPSHATLIKHFLLRCMYIASAHVIHVSHLENNNETTPVPRPPV